MQFPSGSRIWKQMRGETRRTTVFSCTESEGTYWRKGALQKFKQQRRALLEQEVDFRAEISSEESVRIRHVILGTLPCLLVTSLNQDAHVVMNADSDPLRLMGSPAESRRKVVWKYQLLYERTLYSLVVCLNILIGEKLFNGKSENWDQIAPSRSPRARGTTSNFEKERVHREALFNSLNFMSASRAIPSVVRGQKKLCTKKNMPAELHGSWRRVSFKLKNMDKSYVLLTCRSLVSRETISLAITSVVGFLDFRRVSCSLEHESCWFTNTKCIDERILTLLALSKRVPVLPINSSVGRRTWPCPSLWASRQFSPSPMPLCGRIVLVAKFLEVSYPQTLTHADCVLEVQTSAQLLAMDPFSPEFCCAMRLWDFDGVIRSWFDPDFPTFCRIHFQV